MKKELCTNLLVRSQGLEYWTSKSLCFLLCGLASWVTYQYIYIIYIYVIVLFVFRSSSRISFTFLVFVLLSHQIYDHQSRDSGISNNMYRLLAAKIHLRSTRSTYKSISPLSGQLRSAIICMHRFDNIDYINELILNQIGVLALLCTIISHERKPSCPTN